MPIQGNSINSLLDGLLAGGGANLLNGSGSPLDVTYTPDGSNIETINLDLLGSNASIDYMDDGGTPPPIQLGGLFGDVDLIEGLGGRSIETVDVDGPLDLGFNALFGTDSSDNTESGVVIGNGELTAGLLGDVSGSSLESAGATGPLGIALDVLFESGSGSGLTSLLDVGDGNSSILSGVLLDGQGGGIDNLTLNGPLEIDLSMGDGSHPGFPLLIGDSDSPISASLLDNLANSEVDNFDIGLGSIFGQPGLDTGPLDGLLDGLLT